ncbi:MAG: hypothetical protein KGL63_05955 [Betaproteobacteria bacterium]|nr:hypothetical protein [Betaproteobacteria bacterium]
MNPLIIGKNLSGLLIAAAAAAKTSVTAGGAGNNIAVVGLTIDRETLQPYGAAAPIDNATPIGAVFLVNYEAALTATDTLSLNGVKVEHSADGATWETYSQQATADTNNIAWPAAGVVDTGGAGGTTQRGCVAYGTNLQGAMRYVRFDFTPVLSAAVTDTATIMVSAVLSGYGEVPASAV